MNKHEKYLASLIIRGSEIETHTCIYFPPTKLEPKDKRS